MRVAIACSGLGNVKRGYETFAEDLFNRLKGRVDVTLFKGGGRKGKKDIVLPNIKRDSFLLGSEKSRIKWEKRYLIEQCTFSMPLAYNLFKDKHDILHFSDPQLGNNIFHLKKVWSKAPRLLFSNGGPLSPEHYKRFDFIQQLTLHYHEEALKAGISENKMTLLPYGIDTEFFNPSIKSSFREKHGIPEEAFLIISVGAINKSHKRMHWVINEVARVKEKPFLIIIGEADSETPNVKNLGNDRLSKRIKFLKLGHNEMPNAYRAADLFVLASLIEGFGIVFLEAMASELPIIAHDHPNQRWILGDAGLFVDMEKENELASKIEHLMKNNIEAERIGKQGRKRAENSFSWDVLIPKYVEMYKKVLG